MRLTLLIAGVLVFASIARAGDACIEWDIQKQAAINHSQVERLYFEASRWVEQNVSRSERQLRPCIKIHVGQSCPNRDMKGACASPVAGDIYIPEWGPLSPITVAQGTIAAALLHLVQPNDVTAAATMLYAEDKRNFLDYIANKSSDNSPK